MVFSVADIKRDIRIALDQNMSSTPLLNTGDVDTLALDDIIESKIEDAARVVTRDAPIYLLDGGESFGDNIEWFTREGIGGGIIVLPSDFLRLVSFQMSDWSMAVTAAITEDDPLYALQSSRYAGIKGNPQKPVVAIATRPIGLVLEFYSCTAGAGTYIKRATYMPMPKIVGDNISISEKVKPAVVHYAAYLVASSIGQADLAATLLNISKDLLQ